MKATHPIHVLIAPILSEESTIQTEAKRKYTFKVVAGANKKQIREAIEDQWPDVRVKQVNTMNYDGKQAGRRGLGLPGRRSKWKKAIVTLRKGDVIELM